jgi:putative transposase
MNDGDTVRDGRGHPAHLPNVVRFSTPVILFVTVCAADRMANTFASEAMHRILREAWEMASSHKVGAYVLMPDHIHLFCAPTSPDAENVAKWVRYWKSLATRAARGRSVGGASVGLPGCAAEQTLGPPVFQRDCWDTQLRRGEKYLEKRNYVRDNPVRRGWVGCAEKWPYWGVVNNLVW